MTKTYILIVDDDAKARKTLSNILRAKGYAPIAAATGKAALGRIEEEVPAVALIDLKLEDISGLELMEEIKECSPATECIVLTGYATQKSAIEAVNLGAYSYVQKPYDMEQLLVAVRRAIEKREAAESLRTQRDKFEGIIASLADGLDIVGRDYRVRFQNRMLRDRFGDLTGKLCYEEYMARETPCESCPMVEAIATGSTQRVELTAADGREYEVTSTPFLDIDGETKAIEVVRDITERKRAEEALRQYTAQLEAVREVGLEITTELDLDDLLHSIASQAVELLGGAVGGLDLYQPDRDVLEWAASIGLDPVPSETVLHRGEGLSGQVWETGEPLIVDDYQQWEGRAAVWEGYPLRAMVGVPVRWSEEFLGVLEVMAEPPRTFSPADADLLSLFATQAAIAIRNARLYEAEREQRELAEALEAAAAAVSSTLEPDQVLDRILEQVERVVAGDAFNVMLIEDDSVRVVRSRGYERLGVEEQIARFTIPVADYPGLAKMARTGEPIVISDTSTDPDWVPLEGWEWLRSYVGAPIRVGGVAVGILSVDGTRQGQFGPADAHRLKAFADAAATAIENARLFEQAQQEIGDRKRAEGELQKSLDQVRKNFEGTIEILVSTVGIRDPYTADHQRRVTQLANAIASAMDLPEEQIEGIRMAGLVHDIGKMNIPAEILSKPGLLSDFEYGMIKLHVQVGYDVLKTTEFPWPVAQAVLQHHERMDGSGYPQGLSGEDIIMEAKILAVGDVVEAMSSFRPYRSALGIDKALEEISQNKGVLYDAEAVDACLKLFTEKGFEFE